VPAHASLMLPSPPYRPKDFTIVKKDGEYHVFYIRHDITKPELETERDFGHAVSADMYTWYQLPPVIPVRDSSWDNQHVWAPSIVELDSVYYMFYAGVTKRPGTSQVEQRLGLATSTDLMTWNRLDQPLYSCRDVPWAWCDTLNNNNGFRDPFVMPDPSVPGQWLLYYSAFPAADTAGMIVGVAASDGDLTRWTDVMPLWATQQQYSYSSIIESPHLFKHGGLWFMFVTMNAGQPLTFYVTPNPTGSLDQWINRGRLSTMLGIDTRSWYASEYFADGLNDYFAFVNYNRVEIYRMLWTAPDTFRLFEPGDFHIRSLAWSTDSIPKGQNATLTVVATGWAGREAELEAVEKLPDGSEVALAIESLQIPALLPLTSDTTRFEWRSMILHASGDTTGAQTIIVRARDRTAEAKPVTVRPPPPVFEVRSLAWSADSLLTGQPVTLSVVALDWEGHSVALEGVERLPGGGEAPLDLDSLGLPASLPLVADTTRISWTARIRRASGDSTSALTLEMRTTDHAVVATPLRISVPPPPPPFVVMGIRWSADSVGTWNPVTLSVIASGWNGHALALEAVERMPGGGEDSLAMADLGLPTMLTLTADTTRFGWTARIRRASGDTTIAQQLVVRATGGSAESSPLKVTPPPPAPPPPPGGEPEDPPIQDRRLAFRLLDRSVLGDLPSFLVDLPRAARTRLDVYDLQGRRVRTLADHDLAAGANVLSWDGRDAGGVAVGRGLYFARLATPFATRTVKVVLTRRAGAP